MTYVSHTRWGNTVGMEPKDYLEAPTFKIKTPIADAPEGTDAVVTVEAHGAGGAVTGSTTVTLPSGGRLTREVSELLGSVLPTGSYLRVVSAQPVQALGLLGNDKAGTVMPVAMVVLNAPAAPAAPVDGISHGGGKGK